MDNQQEAFSYCDKCGDTYKKSEGFVWFSGIGDVCKKCAKRLGW